MATLVSFHAHPDDESIGGGGTLAKTSAGGHRVVHRWEFLGYVDSGMMGAATNAHPGCFWQADIDQAAERLAAILDEERADALTIYDPTGITGHPDHIQVHRVGARAAALAGTAKVYEGTMNRTQVQRLVRQAAQFGIGSARLDLDLDRFGTPEELITTVVDVREYLPLKRQAMAAHASQISETSFFLAMPPWAFALIWGHEYFIRRGVPPETRETELFEVSGPA
ncbi:MAG: PIG-L family deacetylase [Pseudonocardiaceae bacterium]